MARKVFTMKLRLFFITFVQLTVVDVSSSCKINNIFSFCQRCKMLMVYSTSIPSVDEKHCRRFLYFWRIKE